MDFHFQKPGFVKRYPSIPKEHDTDFSAIFPFTQYSGQEWSCPLRTSPERMCSPQQMLEYLAGKQGSSWSSEDWSFTDDQDVSGQKVGKFGQHVRQNVGQIVLYRLWVLVNSGKLWLHTTFTSDHNLWALSKFCPQNNNLVWHRLARTKRLHPRSAELGFLQPGWEPWGAAVCHYGTWRVRCRRCPKKCEIHVLRGPRPFIK